MKKKYTILLAVFMIAMILGAVIVAKPYVNRYYCVGCGDCTKHCPTNAISLMVGKAVIDTEACVDCGNCIKICQYQAIRRPK